MLRGTAVSRYDGGHEGTPDMNEPKVSNRARLVIFGLVSEKRDEFLKAEIFKNKQMKRK